MDDEEPDKAWDEYDWERFLQQQDRKTEQYMELLEQYIDHPNRDQIIAREMGWTHLLGDSGRDWADDLEAQAESECAGGDTNSEENPEPESFEMHPLYRAAFALTIWVDQVIEELGDGAQKHPAASALSSHASVASAKLAAALADDDVDEVGMTIAYLKRALKAITLGLDAALQLRAGGLIDDMRADALAQRLFQIRDGIVALMGEHRCEWRRRFGDVE